jgi:hypothetical protein
MVAFCLYRVTPKAVGAHFLVGPRYLVGHGFRI